MVIVKNTISSDNIRRFRRTYNKAVKEKKDSFTFDGNTISIDYAKHLIEYIGLTK